MQLCMAMFQEIVLEVGREENGPMTSFGGLAFVWRKLSGHHPQDIGGMTQVIKKRLRTVTVYEEEEEEEECSLVLACFR